MRITPLGGFRTDVPLSKHYALSLVRRTAQERREAGVFQGAGDRCVYVYCDNDEHVFYIGKGAPDRPQGPHEHPTFVRYVNEELGGRYSVHVLETGMSNDAAEDLEQDLLEIFGTGCVNWVDYWAGKTDEDSSVHEQLKGAREAHAKAVQQLLDDIKNTQRGSPKAAITHCRRLIEAQAVWEDAEVARQRADAERKQEYSLKAALSLKWDDFRPTPNAKLSDVVYKLTGLLMKEQAWAEVITSVDWLRERYPAQFSGYVAKREQTLLARKEQAKARTESA